MRHVLVTGATGFIGGEVARQLAASGLRPRLMVRRPWRGALVASPDAELVQADLTRPEGLARAVDGADAVLHLGARATFESYARVRPTIVDGSVALMQAALKAGVRRFVYASSLLVYDGQPTPIDRDTPTRPRSGYGHAKVEAETALGSLAGQAGAAFAAIRLPHVYGVQDAFFGQMRRGRFLFPGRGDNLYAHLHVADAARVLIETARQGWAGAAPVADNRPATWNEFLDVISRYYPYLRVRRLPRWLAQAGAAAMAPVQRLRGLPTLHTVDGVVSSNLSLPVRPGLLWDDLGLEPRYPTIEQGVPAVLDDCVAFRWRHPVDDTR